MSVKLAFGLQPPPTASCAWGARAICTQDGMVDFVPGRSDYGGENVEEFLEVLDEVLPRMDLRVALSNRLEDGIINTREHKEHVIFDDRGIRLVANANASAGYLYMVAYPTGE